MNAPGGGTPGRFRVIAAALACALGGCANAAALALPALSDVDAVRAGEASATFAGLTLQRRRDAVIAALASDARYAAPRCASARLAPVDGARRAFPVERCEHAVTAAAATDAPTLAGRAVAALVTHFVDGRLVRLDVRVASTDPVGDEADGARLAAHLDARLGARVEPADDGAGTAAAIRWSLGADVVELAGAGIDRGIDPSTDPGSHRPVWSRLSVYDGRVLAVLPGIGADDPTATADDAGDPVPDGVPGDGPGTTRRR